MCDSTGRSCVHHWIGLGTELNPFSRRATGHRLEPRGRRSVERFSASLNRPSIHLVQQHPKPVPQLLATRRLVDRRLESLGLKSIDSARCHRRYACPASGEAGQCNPWLRQGSRLQVKVIGFGSGRASDSLRQLGCRRSPNLQPSAIRTERLKANESFILNPDSLCPKSLALGDLFRLGAGSEVAAPAGGELLLCTVSPRSANHRPGIAAREYVPAAHQAHAVTHHEVVRKHEGILRLVLPIQSLLLRLVEGFRVHCGSAVPGRLGWANWTSGSLANLYLYGPDGRERRQLSRRCPVAEVAGRCSVINEDNRQHRFDTLTRSRDQLPKIPCPPSGRRDGDASSRGDVGSINGAQVVEMNWQARQARTGGTCIIAGNHLSIFTYHSPSERQTPIVKRKPHTFHLQFSVCSVCK